MAGAFSPGGARTLGFLGHEPVTVYSPHLWFVVFFFPEDCECAHVPVPHGRLNRLQLLEGTMPAAGERRRATQGADVC